MDMLTVCVLVIERETEREGERERGREREGGREGEGEGERVYTLCVFQALKQ